MLLILGFLLLGMIGPAFAPESNTIFDEVTFKLLDFEFSMLLKNHLRDWRFLTETATVMDTGEFFPKRTFHSHGSRDLISANTTDKNAEKIFNTLIIQNKTSTENTSCEHNYDHVCSSKHTPNARTPTDSKTHDEPQKGTRVARDAGIPVIYMPGSKKKRKCSQVSGLLAGFNTFNYLTFVTGVVTLILNVNNNINNNNNNNNLNNNNDISNNNVNANTNTQNANQVVIFPPGRKRRSIVDFMMQVLSQEAVGNLPSKQTPVSFGGVGGLATEAGMVAIQLFDSWVEATSGVNGECGWAEYCHLLHNLPARKGMSAVLFNSAREFSSVVAPEWVGSAATCFLHRAKCHLI